MKRLVPAATAALLVTAPLAAGAAERTFDLPAFTEIGISSGIDAVVTVGGTEQTVVATSPRQDELDELLVDVSGGRLNAHVDWNLLDIFDFVGGDRQIVITIKVPALSYANADSGADIDVTGMGGDLVTLRSSSGSDVDVKAAAGKRYDIESSSGSDLTIDGTCEGARISVSSGSNLRADRLLCADVQADVSSGSDADIFASQSIKADASSGSDLTVYGSPTDTTLNSSSGADIHVN